MTSAADAEIEAQYINSRKLIPAWTTVEEMVHKQPPTPIQTYNTTALGFVTKNLHPKATNSTDMKHWFMCDRQDRNQFRYYWGSGKYNEAEYYIKHSFSDRHREKRPRYLTPLHALDALRSVLQKAPYIYLMKWKGVL